MDPIEERLNSIVGTNSFLWDNLINIRNLSDSELRADPDMRVYVNLERGLVAGSICFFRRMPRIPPSLTPIGTWIVYVLQEQLSRSPLPMPPQPMLDDRMYGRHFRRLLQIFYYAMQNLRCTDIELERGHREHLVHGTHSIVWETQRRSIALSIVRGLCLLQTPTTTRPSQVCLLCNQPPAPPREPEARPEDSRDTNTLAVHDVEYVQTGRFSESFDLAKVSILPPILEGDDSTPM